MFLSPEVSQVPSNISAMGSFTLLHSIINALMWLMSGIYVEIWTQQQFQIPTSVHPLEVTSLLTMQRRSATILSLGKWRNTWISSMLSTPTSKCTGFLVETAMKRWSLFKLLSEKKMIAFSDTAMATWTDGQRILNMLKLMKVLQASVPTWIVEEDDLRPEIIVTEPIWPSEELGLSGNLFVVGTL
jgi:hypothetical protein